MSDDHDDVIGPKEGRYHLHCHFLPVTRHGRPKEGRWGQGDWQQGRLASVQLPGGIQCTLPIVFSSWGQASNVHVLEYLERGPVRCVRLVATKRI